MEALVSRLTSNDAQPPPAFAFVELAQLQHAEPLAAERSARLLLQRLARPELPVQLKALVAMKHVCVTGRLEFRRALQQQAGLVRAALDRHADARGVELAEIELAEKVRIAAKDALEAIFDANPPASLGSSISLTGRISGFGSATAVPRTAAGGGPPARGIFTSSADDYTLMGDDGDRETTEAPSKSGPAPEPPAIVS